MKSYNRYLNYSKRYTLFLSFLVLLLSFYSSNQWSKLPIGNEYFWWVIQFAFIYILFNFKKIYNRTPFKYNLFYLNIFLIWNIIGIVRGVFVADNYWEWKFLILTSFYLLLPLIVYLTNNIEILQIITKFWFKYGLFIFIFFSYFLYADGVGQFLMPISFLLLFFPFLNFKWKIIIFSFSLYVIFFDFTARSNLIKFIVPFLLGCLFYFKTFLSNKILNILRLTFLLIPFLFLFLALFNIFNIFTINTYFRDQTIKTKTITGEKSEESILVDTRTFLYIEVFESAIRNDYFLFGRTPARGNDSNAFGEYNAEKLKTRKYERFSNEVSILNIFTWLGIVGVLFYFIIFFKASYLAIFQSNNFFIKIVGLNISFRWAYGFIEDFSILSVGNIFLWLMIGMCFSETFRQLSNNQMKLWVLGIIETSNKSRLFSKKFINK
jgi:hypothetical protein